MCTISSHQRFISNTGGVPSPLRFNTYLSTLQWRHYGTMASQVTSLTIVHSTVYSGADQRKYKISASLAFVRWPVNSPHRGPVTWKMFPFDDVIMTQNFGGLIQYHHDVDTCPGEMYLSKEWRHLNCLKHTVEVYIDPMINMTLTWHACSA